MSVTAGTGGAAVMLLAALALASRRSTSTFNSPPLPPNFTCAFDIAGMSSPIWARKRKSVMPASTTKAAAQLEAADSAMVDFSVLAALASPEPGDGRGGEGGW